MVLESIIEKIGSSVCHQLPARSIQLGNIIIPVCARCHGLYIGFLAATIILFLMYRKREAGLPPLWAMAILLVFIVSTLIDGLLSYLGLMSTNNYIRFITGFLCMASIAAIIYPVFVFQYFQQSNNRKVLGRAKHFLLFLVLLALVMAVNLAGIDFLGSFFYYLTAFSVLFTFFFVNLTVIFLIPPLAQKATRLFSKHLFLPSLGALVLTALELYLFYIIRLAAERAWS